MSIMKEAKRAVAILRENEPAREWRMTNGAATYLTGMTDSHGVIYGAVLAESAIDLAAASMDGGPKPEVETCYGYSRRAAARTTATLWCAQGGLY